MTSTNDMDALLETGMAGFHKSFAPGESVSGTVTAITDDFVFLDINAKSEGLVPRAELVRGDELSVEIGDTVSAFFVRERDGEIQLAVRMTGEADEIDSALEDAFHSNIPVEGKVSEERKGGYDVRIGNHRAFCPYSQIDIHRAEDGAIHVGQRYTFTITEYDGDNLVVSRRQFMEAEQTQARDALKEKLNEGDILGGVVRRVLGFGAFIDIGGIEGLCPVREITWERIDTPQDKLKEGDGVKVKLLKLDWEANRFTLSIRQAEGDPWDRIREEDKYHPSKQYHGVATRLMPFGAFIQLEPGVEGLIHISKLGAGKHLKHAREVLHEGEELEVYIDNIDWDRRRISLALENPQLGRTMEVEGVALTIGEERVGTVEDVKQFGIFVRLSPAQVGLLHVSEIPFEGNVNRFRDMWKRFPPSSEITIVVRAIHKERISLTLPGQKDDADEYRDLLKDKQDDLGSMGSAFDGLF
jgi:small subunit ribosomal protein S1